MMEELKKMLENVKSRFTSRTFRIGIYSTVSSIIVIAIAVAVILFADGLPSTYTKFDISTSQLYTLSEQTEKIVKNIDKDVDIYVICQSGNENQTLMKMLERYETLNDRIDVIMKDPVVNPNFASQYTDATVYENSLIVVSGDRSKFVSIYDIFVSRIDYYTYEQSTEFYGENCITSAIDYVTSDELPKLYVLKGHGEKEIPTTAENEISRENILVEELNFLTMDAVPEDADCVLVFSPASDLTETERDKMLTYLKGGGSLFLITDYTGTDMPNLQAIYEYYGVEKMKGIVLEGDPNYCVSRYNHYLLPRINSHQITSPLLDGGYYALMPLAEGLREMKNYRDTVRISKLLTTSGSSYFKTDVNKPPQKEEGDEEGPFNVGMAVTENSGDRETNIVMYTTSMMLDASVNELVAGSNMDLFINSLNWMCEREENISIRPKVITREYLTINAAASSGWSIVLVGVIPVGFLAAGIAVWFKRRCT
jgi:ABC-2 type transport system permease protein